MSVSADWGGIFPATLTMFDERGALDVAAMRDHVARLVEDGAHGIVVCGTTGEFVALSDDERIEAIAAAVAGADERVPVIAGTGAYGTAATIRLTRRAAPRNFERRGPHRRERFPAERRTGIRSPRG